MRTSCIPSANSSIAFVSASPGLSHRKDTPPSPETVVCTDIMYDNGQTLKIAAAITGTLRTLCCHVFAPFALIFSARVHAQIGESQLDLLVPHCDARPWPGGPLNGIGTSMSLGPILGPWGSIAYLSFPDFECFSAMTEAFAPESVRVIDESHQHEGHAGHRPGGESHFLLYIVSEAFRGKSRLERHRMIDHFGATEYRAMVVAPIHPF